MKKQREYFERYSTKGELLILPAAFNPRPVAGPSGSNAEQTMRLPPPPPSERKIARKRESTRAVREQEPDSPPQAKRQKTLSKSTAGRPRGTTPADPLLAELRADAGSNPFQSTAVPRVDFLNFSKSVKGRSAAPRPSSPPRMPDLSHPRQSMGPPTGPYVRKTRKSMRGMGLDGLSAETLVPIPDGETPMIKKNKEMRIEQARRSSLGMRGQRASSSLGRGEISACPIERAWRSALTCRHTTSERGLDIVVQAHHSDIA